MTGRRAEVSKRAMTRGLQPAGIVVLVVTMSQAANITTSIRRVSGETITTSMGRGSGETW